MEEARCGKVMTYWHVLRKQTFFFILSDQQKVQILDLTDNFLSQVANVPHSDDNDIIVLLYNTGTWVQIKNDFNIMCQRFKKKAFRTQSALDRDPVCKTCFIKILKIISDYMQMGFVHAECLNGLASGGGDNFLRDALLTSSYMFQYILIDSRF